MHTLFFIFPFALAISTLTPKTPIISLSVKNMIEINLQQPSTPTISIPSYEENHLFNLLAFSDKFLPELPSKDKMETFNQQLIDLYVENIKDHDNSIFDLYRFDCLINPQSNFLTLVSEPSWEISEQQAGSFVAAFFNLLLILLVFCLSPFLVKRFLKQTYH